MVSIAQTSKKYRGRKAETYDEIRTKQGRWHLENAAVERMLGGLREGSGVLDVPVGTGRFLALYARLGLVCTGVDASEQMLALAGAKVRGKVFTGNWPDLRVGDASRLEWADSSFTAVVCVRFLDLIDEEAMRAVMRELCRVAADRVILTIRLGDEYVPKSNTATHDRKKFNALVKSLGWKIEETVPVFSAGWTVMRLGRTARTKQEKTK